MTVKEPPLEQNGLSPMVNVMQIAAAKSKSAREGSISLASSHGQLPDY